MLKIYFDNSHYDARFRGQLFPLLKPFLKVPNFTDSERIVTYGVSEQDYLLVDSLAKSDIAVLTMSWDYYAQQKKMDLANLFINEVAKLDKIVWTVSLGDLGYKLPLYENVLVFRMSGLKSKLPTTHKGMPVFIDDPLKKQFDQDDIFPISYNKTPTVGFCGYADNDKKEVIKYTAKEYLKKGVNSFRKQPFERQPIFVAPLERFKLLRIFVEAHVIKSSFIYRKKYRAGANTEVLRKKTTLEYFNNIKQSQYILCIRGAGNFSVRFYETLAMGRIPVFINTDCLMPLEHIIDWKKHVVWLEAHDRDNVAQKVLAFHKALSKDQFENICRGNRKLWQDKLSLGGFFKLQKLKN
ncbi:exostosin domain-containing protein [Algibacter mikhailovii]|uniref:Exostosin GT47 domain-containing protein n=1 Tax=Algibacter mikhailovii TaxID=425498 RepID=A0A918R168_9FLAO|nr:exostosin family protein [Algibacter mikhailovii]GGZ80987.1 hypothetical protein GCM10007028_18000 [Algibacter mikhailovii]